MGVVSRAAIVRGEGGIQYTHSNPADLVVQPIIFHS